MPDQYTYIQKPTDATYQYVSPEGKAAYDDAAIAFDDPSAFYDSANMDAYTNVSKPSGPTWDQLDVAWDIYPYQWDNSSYIVINKPTS